MKLILIDWAYTCYHALFLTSPSWHYVQARVCRSYDCKLFKQTVSSDAARISAA